jgi:hypothetical protein
LTTEHIGIAVLGAVLGPIAFLTWRWVFDRIYPAGAGANVTPKQLAQILFGTAAACLAFGVVILAPLAVFGWYPLRENSPYFFWPLFISAGVIGFGIRLWHHYRNLLHARDADS